MLNTELKSKVSQLWNAFWAGGLSNPLTAIEQMSYLIFMKRLDDIDTHNVNAALNRGKPYRSFFEGHEDYRWSNWKNMNAEDMYKHVSLKVFPFIKEIHDGVDVAYAQAMRDSAFMIPKPSLLQEAVELLDDESIDKIDVQGDIYELLLSQLNTAGKNGQFRTPRHVIRMMVELVDPDLGQKICDPACGTGGFLIAAHQHILKKYTLPDTVKIDKYGNPHNLIGQKITDKKYWEMLWNETYHGFDFEVTMIRIAFMNMILHGILNPKIKQIDTLSKRFDQSAKYDIILANPPFAGYIDSSDINENFKIETSKTELLFLQLFYNLLMVGGKAAVIVPNGVLFGSSNAHIKIRELLLKTCQLDAVISMPSGVFQPYSGVGTAVLIFTKGGKTENVWFYDMKKDGYTLDQKRDFIDGKGDIPEIINAFRTRKASNQSITVTFDKIEKNEYSLSISRYKIIEPTEVVHESPVSLIKELVKIEEKILEELQELRCQLE
jgi:type I restriction enzyme M protein